MRLRDRLPGRIRAPLGVFGRRAQAELLGPLQPAVARGRVVAICHCHHPELVPELATRLLSLPRGAALHVTSSRPAVFEAWSAFRRRSRADIAFHLVENRGRDLLPFFTVARTLALHPDAAVLKVHGKRSAYSERGDWWRRDSLRGLLPGPFAAQRAQARFAAEPRLALMGAPGAFTSNPIYWGRNREAVGTLMRDLSGVATQDDDLGFFAGTMFWIRGAFLASLASRVDPSRFEPEPLPQDGAHPHALERAIGMVALAEGWSVGETDRPEPLTREAARSRTVNYL